MYNRSARRDVALLSMKTIKTRFMFLQMQVRRQTSHREITLCRKWRWNWFHPLKFTITWTAYFLCLNGKTSRIVSLQSGYVKRLPRFKLRYASDHRYSCCPTKQTYQRRNGLNKKSISWRIASKWRTYTEYGSTLGTSDERMCGVCVDCKLRWFLTREFNNYAQDSIVHAPSRLGERKGRA